MRGSNVTLENQDGVLHLKRQIYGYKRAYAALISTIGIFLLDLCSFSFVSNVCTLDTTTIGLYSVCLFQLYHNSIRDRVPFPCLCPVIHRLPQRRFLRIRERHSPENKPRFGFSVQFFSRSSNASPTL